MKEVHRVYGIHAGVLLAYKKFPTQYLLQVVAGLLKGLSAPVFYSATMLLTNFVPNYFVYK